MARLKYVKYSKKLGAEICRLVSENYRLNQIEVMPGMPDRVTIWRWRTDHPEFAEKYTAAWECLGQQMQDEILAIADDGKNDWMEREDGSKEWNREHSMRSRLRVDTRKWLMGKLWPKKFGDKLELEHSGEIGFAERLVAARERAAKAESE